MANWGQWLYCSGGPKGISHKRLHKREGGESHAGSGREGGGEAGAMRRQAPRNVGNL